MLPYEIQSSFLATSNVLPLNCDAAKLDRKNQHKHKVFGF
jgi:hypothetical protein